MSDAEENFVAWLRGQGMHDSAGLVERLMSERDALRAKLATAFKDAESAAVDAVNACRQDGEADLRSVRHRVGHAIRGLKGDGDE